jgi:UDP-N-acetylmuramate--alanine ligase
LETAEVRKQLTYQLTGETKEQISETGNHDHGHEHEPDRPDIYAFNIRTDAGGYRFDASISNTVITDFNLNIGGMHNIENALAAITIAKALNIDTAKIKKAVANYKGVKRRFEYLIKNIGRNNSRQFVFIDDYAHHPEELKALIGSAVQLFPSMKCTVVFQPHLFTRTRDLAEGFAAALDMANEVILLPIYPARELPIEGVSSDMIATRMKKASVQIMTKEEYVEYMDANSIGLLITAGAGDIDTIVPLLAKKILAENAQIEN